MFESSGAAVRVAPEEWSDPRDACDADLWSLPPSHVGVRLSGLPGARLATAVEESVRGEGLADLADHDVVGLCAAAHRLSGWALSVQLRAIGELRARYADPARATAGMVGDDPAQLTRAMAAAVQMADDMAPRSVAAEVGLACGMSEYAAGHRLAVARTLDRLLPGVMATLAAGALDWPKVAAFADAVTGLSPEAAVRVEEDCLPLAATANLPTLRRALERAVIAADPDRAAEATRRAVAGRRVECFPAPDGLGEIRAFLPAPEWVEVVGLVKRVATAAKTPDDPRTADQRRADTLVDLIRAGAGVPRPGGSDGCAPATAPAPAAESHSTVVVTLSAATLLGDDEPGDLTGYGPIVAEMARNVARNGTWRCGLTDEHGYLVGLGKHTSTPDQRYRPGLPLDRHTRVRDQRCTFPGCSVPAHRCDLDHRLRFPAGPTCECNLHALCRHHHRLKHEAGFRVEREPAIERPEDWPDDDWPGDWPGDIWTTPAGWSYRGRPTRLPHGRPANGRQANGRQSWEQRLVDDRPPPADDPPF